MLREQTIQFLECTIVFLLLEELLSQFTEYWALIMGPLLLLIVLFARGGIMGVLGRFSRA